MGVISSFWLDGECSTNFGIIMREAPPYVVAERDLEQKSVPGRSGDVLIDNARYKNVAISYKCAVLPENGVEFRTAVERVAEFLQPVAAYKQLINTYDPEYFREARVTGGISVESIMEQAGTFEIAFDCKPQRWLLAGRNKIKLNRPETLLNPTRYVARPIITVYGNKPGVLTIGGVQCHILALTDYITLDCENETARRDLENKNDCVSIDDFPKLCVGKTGIAWDGGITGVAIEARWWKL